MLHWVVLRGHTLWTRSILIVVLGVKMTIRNLTGPHHQTITIARTIIATHCHIRMLLPAVTPVMGLTNELVGAHGTGTTTSTTYHVHTIVHHMVWIVMSSVVHVHHHTSSRGTLVVGVGGHAVSILVHHSIRITIHAHRIH